MPSPAQELVAELGRSSRLPRFRQTPSLPNVRVSAAAPSPHDHFYFQNFSPNFLCSPWKLNAAAFSGVFGELCLELCPQGILHTVLVLDRSCWCLLVPVPSSAEEWAKLSLPPLAAHSSALQVWKLRWDHGAVAGPQLPSLQAPQRVLSATPGTTEPRFPFFSWGRAAVCVCGAFQWRALFSAGFGSALNLLRISSSLAVGWENRVVAVCGTERLGCVPQPVPGVLLVGTSSLLFFFFSLQPTLVHSHLSHARKA